MSKPYHISCHALTPEQQKDIEALTSACGAAESITVAFPADAEPGATPFAPYHLLYLNRRLVSALSLLPTEETTCEAMALTDPMYRRRGYMNLLLDHAYDQLCTAFPEDTPDIAFYTDGKSHDALMALEALECEYWYSELMMSLPLPAALPAHTGSSLRFSKSELPNLTTYEALVEQETVGHCYVLDFTSWYYLYGLEIIEAHRGKGYGRSLLNHIITGLDSTSHTKVKLQVSKQNLPALILYKKAGFIETDRIDYYLY